MILRPLDPAEATNRVASPENQFASAWKIVEQVQRANYVGHA